MRKVRHHDLAGAAVRSRRRMRPAIAGHQVSPTTLFWAAPHSAAAPSTPISEADQGRTDQSDSVHMLTLPSKDGHTRRDSVSMTTQLATARQTRRVLLAAMGSSAVTALLLLSAVCEGQCMPAMHALTTDDAAPPKRGFVPPFYGPMEFDALPHQALNRNQTRGDPKLVGPKTSHYDANSTDFGSVQFSRAIKFNGGRPLLTMGFLLGDGIGVNRDIHWHTLGDEWAYVIKGKWQTTMSAPTKFDPQYRDSLPPWEGTYGIARKGSVWFFPANWWHTITCVDEGGCAAILFFNAPPSAEYEPNSPQLAQTIHGMPAHIAAHVLGASEPAAVEVQRRIRGASRLNRNADYLGVSALTRTVACSQPGFVGQCPQRAVETPSDSFPAVTDAKSTGNTRVFPFIRGERQLCPSSGSFPYGASLWDVTASNFALLKLTARPGRGGVTGPGISGQLIELAPGGTRPPVWTTNADAVLFVAEGFVTLWIYAGDQYNGFAPADSHRLDYLVTTELHLGPNQAAYVPQGQVYYLQEAACAKAVLTVAFNHAEWEEVERPFTPPPFCCSLHPRQPFCAPFTHANFSARRSTWQTACVSLQTSRWMHPSTNPETTRNVAERRARAVGGGLGVGWGRGDPGAYGGIKHAPGLRIRANHARALETPDQPACSSGAVVASALPARAPRPCGPRVSRSSDGLGDEAREV